MTQHDDDQPVAQPAGADEPNDGGRVALLEQQQAVTARALRHILEGRWTGELPHAAADVVELLGGPDGPEARDFSPVDFPGPKAAAELVSGPEPNSASLTSGTGCRGMGPGEAGPSPT